MNLDPGADDLFGFSFLAEGEKLLGLDESVVGELLEQVECLFVIILGRKVQEQKELCRLTAWSHGVEDIGAKLFAFGVSPLLIKRLQGLIKFSFTQR